MIEALKSRTYMVRHNPNCPKRFEVRLTGAGITRLGFPPYVMPPKDIVGYGDTADEAAADALRAEMEPRP